MKLEIEKLQYAYAKENVVDGISLTINKGEFIGLIGPNGCGKSTVLKNVYRSLKPTKGTIYFEGEILEKQSYKETAKKMSVVGQNNEVIFDFTVEEIVAMGRYPYKKLFDIDTKEDKEFILHCLQHLGLEEKAKEKYSNLSGGEKQRVLLARAVAQDTDFMILDEPTNHLDINYQIQIFDLLKQLNITVFTAIHDLNIASLYCDRLFVIHNGKIVKQGTAEEVITKELLKNIYHVDAHVFIDAITRKVHVSYIPEYIRKELEQ